MPQRLSAALFAAGFVFSIAAPAALAQVSGNASAGKNKNSMCVGCHGVPGYKTAYPEVYHVPKIGGQSPTYIANALKAYRSGERWHPSMRGIAASLSDKDIEEISGYYGGGK